MHSVFPQQRYEVPIVMKAVFDFIDTLSTRIKEIEQQRKLAVMCKKEDKSRSLEDFLSRFGITNFSDLFYNLFNALTSGMFSSACFLVSLAGKITLEAETVCNIQPQ